MNADEMLDALGVPFPKHAIEQRQGGGGKMFDYVATETVIRFLNTTAKVWDFEITSHTIIGDVLVVFGKLTIPGLGTRSGTGVQKLQGGEDTIKGAASDCLKKCATLFGVALDLYGPDLLAGEIPNERELPARTRTTSQNTIPDQERYPSGVTKKQIAAIGAIASDRGIPADVVKRFHGKESATLLTSQEASALIERLKAEPNWHQPEAGTEQAPMMPAGADRYTS